MRKFDETVTIEEIWSKKLEEVYEILKPLDRNEEEIDYVN